MKRKVLCISLTALLAGCGSPESEPTPSNSPTAPIAIESAPPAPLKTNKLPEKKLPLYGQWIPDVETCPNKGELTGSVMNISRDVIERYENYCAATLPIPSDGKYVGTFTCASEGEEAQSNIALAVSEDGKLQFESDGAITMWKRCPWILETP